MNRILAFGLPLAALALLAACGRDQTGEAALEDTPASEAAAALDFSVEQAEITATFAPAIAAQPALYDRLRAQAEAEAEEAKQVAAEDAAMRAQEDFPFRPHTLIIEWETAFENDRVLSLLRTTYVDQGGAHPNVYFDALTWDKAAQAQLSIGGILTDDAWPALSSLAEQALMAQKRERLGADLSDDQYWRQDVIYATAPAAENFELFTLVPAGGQPETAGGIELHYAPYAVGPYVEGDYHIVIPQSAFAQYARPEFAGLFGGEPTRD